jgi:hypothetical protein
MQTARSLLTLSLDCVRSASSDHRFQHHHHHRPFPRVDGRFRASVSIRSGHGSACTDRVMRFTDTFDSADAAHHHAHAQGLMWVAHTVPGQALAAAAPSAS